MIRRVPELQLFEDEIIVDSFAGGGGASTGIEWATGRSPDIAVNHDPKAIAMHAKNHPRTRHLVADVFDVSPKGVCAGRKVGAAWFSPDCTFHSKARGGKPFRDRTKARRRRGLAGVVVRWAKEVRPRVIFVENVEEFQDWGPLLPDGTPCPARRGLSFRRWVKALENAGYKVEMRELRACDYGAPTIRKRLFVIARCDGQPIVWPAPTHGKGLQPYRTAADCIDWAVECRSIFGRKKELAEKTLRRIALGVQRYVIDAAQPFIAPVQAVVAAALTKYHGGPGGARRGQTLDLPFRTLDTSPRFGLFGATLIQTGYGERPGQEPRVPGLGKPLGTIMAEGGKHALVAAFMAKHYTGVVGTELPEPLGTVTSVDHHSLVASSLLLLHGSRRDGQQIKLPLPTVRAGGTHIAEVRAFLTKYNGTAVGQSLQLSLETITTKARFGLVMVHGEEYAIGDIGMRMLTPRELFRAQGFPDSYVIDLASDKKRLTQEDQVRMAGNSVCPVLACVLVGANFGARSAARVA